MGEKNGLPAYEYKNMLCAGTGLIIFFKILSNFF